MGSIHWSEPALDDVREIVYWIARDSSRYAARTGERLIEAPLSLVDHPRSGARVPEFDSDSIREVFVDAYRVIYEIRNEDCFVVAVIHGARDLNRALEIDQTRSLRRKA